MKNRILTSVLFLILVVSLAVSANAYIAGDTNNDFLITAADARFALRLSVGLETCDPESDQFKAADIDGNKIVSASDARMILRASVNLEKLPENTENKLNITMTKIPYTTNGLTITSVTEADNYFILTIKNNTSKTDMSVAASSSIPYKIYNDKGNVIASSSVSVNQMNHGESCTVKIYKPANTAKLIFGAAYVKFEKATLKTETVVVNGLTINKTPFTYNGFRVDKLTYEPETRKVTAEITNISDKTKNCYIFFKQNDTNGNALSDGSLSTCSLAPGEKFITYTNASSGAAKFIAYDLKSYETQDFSALSNATAVTSGITHTKLPLTSQGITFNLLGIDISESGYIEAKIKITNKTGKTLDPYENRFYYKTYDKNGFVIGLSSESISMLDNGESCILTLDLGKNTSKFVLGNLSVKTTDPVAVGKTSVINGITTNAENNTFSGVKISDIAIDKSGYYTTVTYRVTNTSSKTMSTSSSYKFKALSSDKTVLDADIKFLDVRLNPNEYYYDTIYLETEDIASLFFYSDEIKNCDTIKDSSSYTNISGIKVTSTPYSSNGLTITSYRIDEYGELYITIRNDTGKSVKNTSCFHYRIHGTDGSILRDSIEFCEQMNIGETCEIYTYIPDDAAKITFLNADIRTVD